MAELLVVRHAQASFGTDNYDVLSDLGHKQSELAGDALREAGWIPDKTITGSLVRQLETLESMGFGKPDEVHEGLNEYDAHDLLAQRFGGEVPQKIRKDRKTHYRTLRDTILEWQAGGFPGARESWAEFAARVEAARVLATDTEARRVLVVSSGGPIGQLVATTLEAPTAQMMTLNLQMKNTSKTRFFFNAKTFILNEFNTTPHFAAADRAEYLTFS